MKNIVQRSSIPVIWGLTYFKDDKTDLNNMTRKVSIVGEDNVGSDNKISWLPIRQSNLNFELELYCLTYFLN